MTNFKIIIVFALIACIFASPVSAEYYEEEITDTYYSIWQKGDSAATQNYQVATFHNLYLPADDKTKYTGCYYIAGTAITATNEVTANNFRGYDTEPGMPLTIYDSAAKNYIVAEGSMNYYVEKYAADTDIWYVDYTMHLDSWNIDAIVENSTDSLYYENEAEIYPLNNYKPYVNINYNTIYKQTNAITIGATIPGTYGPSYHQYIYNGDTYFKYPLAVTAYLDYWSFSYSTDYTIGTENEISFDINIPTYYNISSGNLYLEYTESGTRDIDFFLPLALNVTNPFTKEVIYREIGEEDIITWPVTVTVVDLSSNSLIGGANVTFIPLTGDGSPDSKILGSGHGKWYLENGIDYNVTATASGFKSVLDQPIEYGLATGPNIFQIQMIPDVAPPVGDKEIVFIVNQYADATGTNYIPVQNALITINNNETALTTESGMARFTINTSQTTVPYTVTKTNYVSVSGNYAASPALSVEYIPILMREDGEVITGEPTPIPTKDIRTDAEKAESAFSMIMDNIEGLTALGLCVVIMSFIGWMRL